MRKTGARRRNDALATTRRTSNTDQKTEEQTMHHHVHVAKANRNAPGRFKRPMDVVEATGIPAIEKLSILKAWEADERALLRAEDEGMGGGEHAHLHRVREALTRLQSPGRTS
jgi:hypothetical protein